jgi:hypothetical protein
MAIVISPRAMSGIDKRLGNSLSLGTVTAEDS